MLTTIENAISHPIQTISAASLKIDDYIKAYKEVLDLFIDYTSEIQDGDIKGNLPGLKYYINEMELRLLYVIQYAAFNDPKWLLQPDNYTFILVEVFFVKLSKDTLSIPASDEFTAKSFERIYPTIKSLIQKLDNEAYDEIFITKKTPDNFSFFHKRSATTISKLVQQTRNIVGALNISIKAHSEIEILREFMNSFLSNENRASTLTHLSNSIEYRIKVRNHYEQIAEADFAELEKITDNNLSNMANMKDFFAEELEDLCKSDPTLSKEDKSFLQQQQFFFDALAYGKNIEGASNPFSLDSQPFSQELLEFEIEDQHNKGTAVNPNYSPTFLPPNQSTAVLIHKATKEFISHDKIALKFPDEKSMKLVQVQLIEMKIYETQPLEVTSISASNNNASSKEHVLMLNSLQYNALAGDGAFNQLLKEISTEDTTVLKY